MMAFVLERNDIIGRTLRVCVVWNDAGVRKDFPDWPEGFVPDQDSKLPQTRTRTTGHVVFTIWPIRRTEE